MEPLAVAGVVVIATALVLAIAVGAAGGAIAGALEGDLAWGALAVLGAYVAVALMSDIWRATRVGLFPAMLTFLAAALTARQLRARIKLHPALAALAGLACALGVGFLYLMPIRSGNWRLVDPGTAWMALGIFIGLVILAIRNRMRAPKSGNE